MNNKVVYIHKNPITLEVFYVGMGNIHRPYSGSRNMAWKAYVSKCGGFLYEIIELQILIFSSLSPDKLLIQKAKSKRAANLV